MLKSIEEEWLGFAAMVIPNVHPQSVQYIEMKKAFFAGAWSNHCAVLEIGHPNTSDEESSDYLLKITAEFNEFKASLMRDYGERN